MGRPARAEAGSGAWRRRRWAGAAAMAMALGLAPPGAPAAATVEEVVTLPSAGTARLLYLRGHDPAQAPHTLAVLFNGGGGAVGLSSKGIPRPGANFLVRTRALFNERGVATAVIDVPSDLASLTDADRMSQRHVDDVRSVVDDMRQRFGALPVVLVGTSRGTVSAAHAGQQLGDRVDGVVLTSSVFNATRGGVGLSRFDVAAVKPRLLFVHHADDTCVASPYWMAERVAAGRALVTVRGGTPARSEPCEPFAPHGYYGVEAPTVEVIVRWMRGAPVPSSVP